MSVVQLVMIGGTKMVVTVKSVVGGELAMLSVATGKAMLLSMVR